ncbi:MAG: ABC transporter permease [Candidatus ainarchaeum sp.]|nr:ABC transporter permease [Candidatus ainarchaeum sp.]
MKLLAEIEKDGKTFLRERRTLILLVAAPLIVLLVLAGVFGKPTAEKALPVSIGLCDLDRSEASSLFMESISSHSNIIDYSGHGGCADYVRSQVSQGQLSAAIIIPKGFQAGIAAGASQNVTVFLDNSRVQISPSVEAFLKAAAQGTGQEIGSSFVLSVWARLDNASAQLDGLLVDVNASREKALEMQERIGETHASLSALDFSTLTRQLDAANSTLDGAASELRSAESNLTLMQEKLATYGEELNSTEADLLRVRAMLQNASDSISSAGAGVNCSDPVFFAYCASLSSMNGSVASALSEIDLRISKINETREDLRGINSTMQDFKENIANSLSETENVRARISTMYDFASSLEESREDSLRTMVEINRSAAQLVAKSDELEVLILNSKAQINEITSRDAISVVAPIVFASQNAFASRTFFDFLLPSLIPLILMFVSLFLASTSLVREKNAMTLERVYVAQVPLWEYALTKITSYTVVLFPEVLLLLATASLAYGAFPLSDASLFVFLAAALMLLLFAFNALGVVIAAFSESEATAFLASLVIGLPLLFLSGILFPFEFMPAPIVLLGQATPLTPAITAMQSAILYATPNFSIFATLLAYGIVLAVLAAGALYATKGRG